MPNYLAGDIASGGYVVEAVDNDPSNFENVGNSRAASQGFSSASAAVSFSSGFDGQGPGSKPAAMHTEFAGEPAGQSGGGGGGDNAYTTEDLVFYLERGDGGGGGDGGGDAAGFSAGGAAGRSAGSVGASRSGFAGEVWDDSSSSMVPIGANGRSGPVPENGELQSGLNQIAMGRISVGRSIKGGPMAPLGGFDFDMEVDLGEITQNAPVFSDINISVINAMRRVKELSEFTQKVGLGSSEKLFSRILNANFNPDFDSTAIRNDTDILDTYLRTSTGELSFLLAREVAGRLRNKDIVRAINDGKLGRLTERSRNFQSRIGNPGRAPK